MVTRGKGFYEVCLRVGLRYYNHAPETGRPMAKLIYGVSGEGSGHSSRAHEMICHLESAGHTVKVASYDRGFRNLSPDFDVLEIEGLHIASADNKISVVETFTENLRRISGGVRKLRELRQVFHVRGFCRLHDRGAG